MAKVTVAIHAPIATQLRLAEGYRMVRLELDIGPGESVRAVIQRLCQAYPSIDAVVSDPHVVMAVNMVAVTTQQELDEALDDGAEIALLSSYAGG